MIRKKQEVSNIEEQQHKESSITNKKPRKTSPKEESTKKIVHAVQTIQKDSVNSDVVAVPKGIKIKKVATVNGISRLHEGTLRVSVSSVWKHPLYQKRKMLKKNYMVDCPKDSLFALGQTVYIKPIARVSKRKSWQVIGA